MKGSTYESGLDIRGSTYELGFNMKGSTYESGLDIRGSTYELGFNMKGSTYESGLDIRGSTYELGFNIRGSTYELGLHIRGSTYELGLHNRRFNPELQKRMGLLCVDGCLSWTSTPLSPSPGTSSRPSHSSRELLHDQVISPRFLTSESQNGRVLKLFSSLGRSLKYSAAQVCGSGMPFISIVPPSTLILPLVVPFILSAKNLQFEHICHSEISVQIAGEMTWSCRIPGE
ncbi:hypothetical protein Tco_0013614 [Tanacetum coccineum]